MKRIIAFLLVAALVFSFAACSAKTTDNTNISLNEQTDSTATQQQISSTDQKVLVIYFSSANTADVDAVSSATPNFDGVGSTGYLAEYIHSKVGGDIEKITPVKDYPTGYNETADMAKEERDRDDRPKFKDLSLNPEDYDVIFVGYPVWWYTLPMIMYSFFDSYDFSGKTIIPFNTHEGSGDGGTYDTIKELEPAAKVLEGFEHRGSSVDDANNDLDKWLSGLDV